MRVIILHKQSTAIRQQEPLTAYTCTPLFPSETRARTSGLSSAGSADTSLDQLVPGVLNKPELDGAHLFSLVLSPARLVRLSSNVHTVPTHSVDTAMRSTGYLAKTPSGLVKPCAHRANPPTNEPAANGQAFSTVSEQSRHVQAGFLRYHLCSQ